MGPRHGSVAPRRRRLDGRLADLERRLEKAERQIDRLENTLQGVVRTIGDVSVGGPCECGESLLLVDGQTIYCPHCRYRRPL